MIADIIKDVYSGNDESPFIKQLLQVPIICGSLFRSFDDFTQHLIFQMYANGGSITRKQILSKMERSPHFSEGQSKFSTSMSNLVNIKVVNRNQMDGMKYTLNESFQTRLNEHIMAIQREFGQPHNLNKDQFFNLLLLLRENNQILKKCSIGSMNSQENMTKQNFQFIRRPIGYKISILIKGFLKLKKNPKERRSILKNILVLSNMDINNKYKVTPQNSELINELKKIRLVWTQQNFFIISPFLYNFAFQGKKNVKLLQCSIIVETNFKVYVQITKSANRENYRLIKDIMQNLIKIDHADYQFQELIVGEIDRDKVMNLFRRHRISVQDYLSFFLQYMSADLNIEKDLGKWNKIKFLGLEGPEGQMMIPNNVKQELKLWQTMTRNGNRNIYEDANPIEEYDYYN